MDEENLLQSIVCLVLGCVVLQLLWIFTQTQNQTIQMQSTVKMSAYHIAKLYVQSNCISTCHFKRCTENMAITIYVLYNTQSASLKY